MKPGMLCKVAGEKITFEITVTEGRIIGLIPVSGVMERQWCWIEHVGQVFPKSSLVLRLLEGK